MNVVFTQISAKQGIKNLKERYTDAIVKEYTQLHDINMFGIVCPEDMTTKHKRYALRASTLIEDKQYRKIKGRACADGRAQRSYITKEEESVPRVSMEELLAQLMIDAFKDHAMAMFDVPSAYLNVDMPEEKFVLLKLED